MIKKLTVLLLLTMFSGLAVSQSVEVLECRQIAHGIKGHPLVEGNESINQYKKDFPKMPSVVSVFLKNNSDNPPNIKTVTINGIDIQEYIDNHSVIWWRVLPETLPANGMAEVSICIRETFDKPQDLKLIFEDGSFVTSDISVEKQQIQIDAITFADGLKKVYVFVKTESNEITSAKLLFDGESVEAICQWKSTKPVNGYKIACIEFEKPLERGSRHFYTVISSDMKHRNTASLRSFDDLAIFGTYGCGDFERYKENDLNGYVSFKLLNKESLDKSAKNNIRSIIDSHGNPPEYSHRHPGVYAYGRMDEPDLKDYYVKELPIEFRPGYYANKMIETVKGDKVDPTKPSSMTLDLTFLPKNYIIYGQIPDIVNSDMYSLSLARSINIVPDHLDCVRNACKPKPFAFTFQSCWERSSNYKGYASRQKVLKDGFDKFTDLERKRGFDRAPVPDEITIQMLYALGKGAKGLFSWFDQTCAGSGLVFIGTQELEQNWKRIGRDYKTFGYVEDLIEISNPMDWAKASLEKVWLKTLVSGEKFALVVAVNQDYECSEKGFTQTQLQNVSFDFPNLDWLSARNVFRVTENGFVKVNSKVKGNTLAWQEDVLCEGQLYLVAEQNKLDDKELGYLLTLPPAEEISTFEQNCYKTYIHTNGFVDDRIFLRKIFEDGTFGVVSLDLNTMKQTVILKDMKKGTAFDIASKTGKILYTNNKKVYLADINKNAEPLKVWDRGENPWMTSVTDDGLWGLIFWEEANQYHIDKINLKTFEIETLLSSSMAIGHTHFSPYDSSWIGFCHEGNAMDVNDRVWGWHKELAPNGKCLFDQENDVPGEKLCIGHERWAFDSLSTYAIAYGISPGTPTGLWQIFTDGRKARLVSESNNDWHCDVSRDGKWAVVDTTGKCEQSGDFDMGESGISDILLVNTGTGERTHIARSRIHQSKGARHFHPHPMFSPDGKWVYYNYAESIESESRNSVWRVNISKFVSE